MAKKNPTLCPFQRNSVSCPASKFCEAGGYFQHHTTFESALKHNAKLKKTIESSRLELKGQEKDKDTKRLLALYAKEEKRILKEENEFRKLYKRFLG